MKIINFIIIIIFIIGIPAQVFAQAATLSLDPAAGTFNKGCNFSLKVNLDTGGAQTDGTDAIIIYDAAKFNAASITNGVIYPDYPGNNIDSQNGKITISGLASVNTPFTGKGTLATINFTVQSSAAAGATQISFDFDPNNKAKTTDSNVVQRGTVADVLNSVVNGSYTVGSGSCGSQVVATSVPGGQGSVVVATPAGQPKTLDQFVDQTGKGPGTPQLTFALAIVGGILAVLGVLGLALL